MKIPSVLGPRFLCALCVTAVNILAPACIQPKPLPRMGAAPAFQLTTQDGASFDSQSLAGHVWVADFVYTTCQGPCPMMSSQMRQIQSLTAETPDVKLVSFTVDPQHDTPPILAAYAKHFKYDPARWVFLTGDQARLNGAGLGFKLNSVDGSTTHSTRFVLVDRRQQIRGFYISSDDGFIQRLLHDIRQLERETS
jgi:protein SCO1